MSDRSMSWGPEDHYGVAGATPNRLLLAGESLKRRSDFRTVQPSRRHSPTRQSELRRRVDGSLDVYLSYAALAQILIYLVGMPTIEDLGSGAIRMTFVPNPQYRPSSLTVDIAREVELHRYTGVFLTSGRLSFGLGDAHFGLSLGCQGKDEGPGGAVPAATDAEFPVPESVGDTGAPTAFRVQLSDGSTTWIADPESFEVTTSWDRRPRLTERSLTPTGMIGGGIVATGAKAKVFYGTDSDFLLDAIRSRASVGMALTMQGALIGGGIYQGLDITLPACKVNGDPPTLRSSGYGNIDFGVDLQSLLDDASGYGPIRYRVTVPAPSIDSLDPTGGLTAGGETITITGTDLL